MLSPLSVVFFFSWNSFISAVAIFVRLFSTGKPGIRSDLPSIARPEN
jgi:hypothetical protein